MFQPIRSSARYCSEKCKQADYRSRKNETIKITVLVFAQEGCRPCALLKESIKKFSKTKTNMNTCKFIILNPDDHVETARDYKVRQLPTSIFLSPDADILSKFAGSMDVEEIKFLVQHSKEKYIEMKS
jgi:thioredoxin-like negative regulator of GroEL